MATIAGTIQDVAQVNKEASGIGSRELWLVAVKFAAYTGAADDASLIGVGAAIDARARDGKTRTLRWAAPGVAGTDTNDQAVYFVGASVQALAVSGDDLAGELGTVAGVELTASTASEGVGIYVAVDPA